jgi:hypothetical protein
MCCGWLLRALRGLCGGSGRSVDDDADGVARQALLGPGAQLSNGTRAAVEPHVEQLPSQPDAPTTIIVMRHGHRQDEEDAFWHHHARRPWDPPLSAKGRVQVRHHTLGPALPSVQRSNVPCGTTPYCTSRL